MDQGLQVTIQIFVRVKFRGVGRQEEDLNVRGMIFQPLPNLGTPTLALRFSVRRFPNAVPRLPP